MLNCVSQYCMSLILCLWEPLPLFYLEVAVRSSEPLVEPVVQGQILLLETRVADPDPVGTHGSASDTRTWSKISLKFIAIHFSLSQSNKRSTILTFSAIFWSDPFFGWISYKDCAIFFSFFKINGNEDFKDNCLKTLFRTKLLIYHILPYVP